MAVIHKGVDRIIDSANKTLEVGVASDAVAAVNDGTTGLASKASSSDLTNGLATKLDATATAADSSKLNGHPASHYAPETLVIDGLGTKLDATAQAADSAKLNGQAASYYATATSVSGKLDSTAQAVDSAQLGGQSSSYYVATTGLAATTDGSTALGWDGTHFKVVPAGSSVVTKRTNATDGYIEFVFPTS